jgi:hypothetical protein
MILNPESIPALKTFKCKSKLLMRYFVYDNHIPLFSLKDNLYHFVYNDNLKKVLKDAPIWITLLIVGEGLNKDLDKE